MEIKKATSSSFEKYGKIVSSPQGEPTSQGTDYKFWSDIADYNLKGETEIGVCTVYKQPENIISSVERHMLTPEILIPIEGPFVIPLLLDGEPDSSMEAFKVDVGEAIVINDAVWHSACIPYDTDEVSYFVIFRKRTPFEDVEKKNVNKIKLEF